MEHRRAGVVKALVVLVLVRLAATFVNTLLRHGLKYDSQSKICGVLTACVDSRFIWRLGIFWNATPCHRCVLSISCFPLPYPSQIGEPDHPDHTTATPPSIALVSAVSIMFRATSRLLDCRITFFTRSPCGLCDTAKAVVQNVNAKRPLQYTEINVMEPGQEKWKSVYEFDTPVVSCH
jgi:hypothetical protein